eukprot:CAMPEP_0185922450 /NCGR_PEP_ID=MMETSP0924C-20121207/10045_1 /TAXON_ID=321610 /ORGANISM="Perkinsus chesapeaki, Strain ATCC PRA-65" /LENGTH=41 /DNA_ID= /DNA_START= /DNA_END= /DNA_ORIENTATION=
MTSQNSRDSTLESRTASMPHGDMDDACGNHNWVEAYIPDPQ